MMPSREGSRRAPTLFTAPGTNLRNTGELPVVRRGALHQEIEGGARSRVDRGGTTGRIRLTKSIGYNVPIEWMTYAAI
jgi:hypothetical protein